MIVVELTPSTGLAGTLTTLYWSAEAFVTEPTDTPPNVAFEPRLIDPGSIGLHAYAVGQTTGGGTKLEAGEITMANADGELDYLLDYGFDGQSVIIRSGEAGTPYPSAWQVLFNGTAEGIDTADWRTLTLRLRDRQYTLELEAQTNTYLGNNALPLGFEGTPDDLMGQAKPQLWGAVFQISPALVNTSKLTYQVRDGAVQTISMVYDRGVPLSVPGADFATPALLQASTPAAGSYNTCLSAGLFQLAANPAGTVTADVVQGVSIADRSVAKLLREIAIAAGIPPGDISASDIEKLDAISPGEAGIFNDSSSATFLSLMDDLAASIGAWYGFDATGVLRMGQLSQPTGTPRLSLSDFDVADSIERLAAYDNNIPVWWVIMRYAKVWTTQTDLAGSVPASTKAYLKEEYRKVSYKDEVIQKLHKLATKLEVDSLLTKQTDATSEASRLFQLYSVRRDIFEVTISIDLLPENLTFMDVIELSVGRFGVSSGKLFRLIGISYKLQTAQVTLSLWG